MTGRRNAIGTTTIALSIIIVVMVGLLAFTTVTIQTATHTITTTSTQTTTTVSVRNNTLTTTSTQTTIIVSRMNSTLTLTSTLTTTSTQTTTVVSQRNSTVTTTVLYTMNFYYLTTASGCAAGGKPAPCWGTGGVHDFNCLSAAETQQGCTQLVQTDSPGWNYTINIRYPFSNQTEPSWANCLWTIQGEIPGQGYAYCSLVNSTAFTVATPAPELE
jgi:hypothetical protein